MPPFLRILATLLFACSPILAQTASSYSDWSISNDTLYAYTTIDGGMGSSNCMHTYDAEAMISGPQGTNGGNSTQTIPASSPLTLTSNAQMPVMYGGKYHVNNSAASAYCSCVNDTFYSVPANNFTVGPPVINPGGIVIYSNSTSGTVTSVEPGTTGVLAIYGQYLTAEGQDWNPTVQVTNGITITGYASVDDGQINANYSATSAAPGSAAVTVTTSAGTSAAVQIQVGDLTPAIDSVSRTSFYVSDEASFTISGQHFGSNCSVSFPFAATIQSLSCTDSSINVSMTPTGAGTGEIIVTAGGYGGQPFDPAPGQQSKSGSSPQITSNGPRVFTVTYETWIPFDHVSGFSSCFYPPYTVTYLYNGNPTTGTFAGGYKAYETVQVTPDLQTYTGFYQDTGETFQFAYLSPKNGSTLSQADLDNVYNDCYLFNNEGKATPAFSYTVTFPQAHQAQVLFTGSVGNPLEMAAGAIRWNVRAVISTTNPTNVQSYVNYNTTCFPGHEVAVNSTPVWSYTPLYSTPLYISACLGSVVTPAVNPLIGQTGNVNIP